MKTSAILCATLFLVACGETTQDSLGSRVDKPAVAGTGVAVYTDPGWTVGDKASWANHLKARASYGQNDHARAPK